VKKARVESTCECQAKLLAELDERRRVVRGWARPSRGGELTAPAHSIGAGSERFQVAWACPYCTRNVVRSFDASALVHGAA